MCPILNESEASLGNQLIKIVTRVYIIALGNYDLGNCFTDGWCQVITSNYMVAYGLLEF